MASEPRAKNLADLYHLPPLDWTEVRRAIETNLTQEPGSGGPGHHTFWLSTIDADGRPHMTAIGAFWIDGRYYFCGGVRSRKIRNVERDGRCAFGVAIHGYDVALEGQAVRVTDVALLQRLAGVFAEGGWAPTVAGGGFTHQYSAPSASPPPWYAYERHPMDLLTLRAGREIGLHANNDVLKPPRRVGGQHRWRRRPQTETMHPGFGGPADGPADLNRTDVFR